MNEKTEIIRSKKPVQFQMLGTGIMGVVLFIFSTQVFRGIDNLMPLDMSGLTSLVRWLVLFVTIIGIAMVWVRGNKSRYYVTKDSVLISRGSLGTKRQQIYGMDNVTGMRMEQSFLGSKYNYGHITLDLSLMTSAEVVRLTNVDSPEETVQKLRLLTKKH